MYTKKDMEIGLYVSRKNIDDNLEIGRVIEIHRAWIVIVLRKPIYKLDICHYHDIENIYTKESNPELFL